MGERHRLDLGPRKGQAFLLTTTTLHIATSSLTLIQNFLLGIPAPRKGEAGGSCAQALFGCMRRSKHKAWLTEPWMQPPALPASASKATGDVRGPSGCSPALLQGPRTQTHQVPQGVGQQHLCSPSPLSHPKNPPKPQLVGATTNSHRPERGYSRGKPRP